MMKESFLFQIFTYLLLSMTPHRMNNCILPVSPFLISLFAVLFLSQLSFSIPKKNATFGRATSCFSKFSLFNPLRIFVASYFLSFFPDLFLGKSVVFDPCGVSPPILSDDDVPSKPFFKTSLGAFSFSIRMK